MEKFKKRGNHIYIMLGLLLIMEIGGLFYHSGIITGVNARADKLKVYAIAERENATILPGDMYDRNGNWLVETSIKEVIEVKEDGTEKTKNVRTTTYSHGMAYSQILGYPGVYELNPNAELLQDVVKDGDRKDYRLFARLDESDWGENGVYAAVDIDGTKGQSAILTLDNELQMVVYEALKAQMSETDTKGSAVVLDAKTGEILSIVSFPTYDFNELDSAKVQINKDGEETNLEPSFPVTHKNAEPPGSIFKIFMIICLIDHGMEDFTVVDAPFQIDGWTCKNDYVSPGDTINYVTALERSSNVFFAKAALELGEDKIKETAAKFGLLEDASNIKLDFAEIPYNWDLEIKEEDFEKLLAQTGFGQGKTELTTIHAAMMTQAIANDGVMLKPYLIKNLVDANGKVTYEGNTQVFGEVTSKSTADKVTKAMVSTAKHVSKSHANELGNTAQIFEKYQVAGKTGTAQTGDTQKTTDAWFVSFAPADEPQYVVVVNQCNSHKSGYQMMTTAADIYEYLFDASK